MSKINAINANSEETSEPDLDMLNVNEKIVNMQNQVISAEV